MDADSLHYAMALALAGEWKEKFTLESVGLTNHPPAETGIDRKTLGNVFDSGTFLPPTI